MHRKLVSTVRGSLLHYYILEGWGRCGVNLRLGIYISLISFQKKVGRSVNFLPSHRRRCLLPTPPTPDPQPHSLSLTPLFSCYYVTAFFSPLLFLEDVGYNIDIIVWSVFRFDLDFGSLLANVSSFRPSTPPPPPPLPLTQSCYPLPAFFRTSLFVSIYVEYVYSATTISDCWKG